MSIVDMYKSGKTLDVIAKELGVSKRTIQRRITEEGYEYNREQKTYIKVKDVEIKQEIKEVIVNRTYAIQQDIDTALKLKSVLEGKTVTDILRDILKNNIEQKYFDMAKDV